MQNQPIEMVPDNPKNLPDNPKNLPDNLKMIPDNPKNLSDNLKKINKLVLSGGGLRGCVYIGILKYLEEKNIIQKIDCIGGTSIGALVGVLVTMSYTSIELEHTIRDFEYTQYNSVNLCHLFVHFGIDTFEKIMEFIVALFTRKNYPPYITFADLYTKTNKHLIINAVCLNTHENTIFDYQLTPNMPVITAMRASMTLPFIFGSVKYNGLTYVDGGLLNNFLIDLPIFKNNPDTVLGINLHNSLGFSVREIQTLDQYVINLFSCLYDAYIKLSINTLKYSHIISIIAPKFNTYDFTLTNDDKQFLVDLGYRKVSEHFANLDQCTVNVAPLPKIRQLLENKQVDEALHMIDQLIIENK